MIERISHPLRPHWGKRLFILFGSGIDDAYIDDNLAEVTIESALLSELLKKGYERILFSSPIKSIYFLDDASREKTSLARQELDENPNKEALQIVNIGPFNNLQMFKPITNTNTILTTSGSGSLTQMGDIHSIGLLDWVMKDFTTKSAVIFVQAETTLSQYEDQRIMAGTIGSWTRIASTNQNACFFIFSAERQDQLDEILQRLPVPELRAFTQADSGRTEQNALIKITGPGLTEIDRLIKKLSQEGELEVPPEHLEDIEKRMVTESTSIRQWIIRLRAVRRLNIQNIQKNNWFKPAGHMSDLPVAGNSANQQLNQMIGLTEIKQRLVEISAWLTILSHRKNKSPEETPTLHMIFSGNPGTGKTTVARLFGELLREAGVLKRGHVVEATGSHLVAEFVGNTAIKTNNLIDTALDGILFIDEAYVLSEPDRGGFGSEAIDTLLVRLETDRSRLVVILAGYPARMKRFLESNPGLARRFPVENIFNFPDYNPQELWDILVKILARKELTYETETENALKQVIEALYERRDERFGNAGDMRNLAEAIDRRRAVRLVQNNLPLNEPIQVADMPEAYAKYLSKPLPNPDDVLAEINALVGLPLAKKYLSDLFNRLKYEEIRKLKEPAFTADHLLQHLVFKGNPGTGKTTLARLVAKIYLSLGILKKGHCVEVSRYDLVAGYLGQTAIKTREKFMEALDGVLFIDEAYALTRRRDDAFGLEAVDTLTKLMEDYRGRVVVIVAGYPTQMDEFLQSNPGLASRFYSPIKFSDFNKQDLKTILSLMVEKEGYILPLPVLDTAVDYLMRLRREIGNAFGNARSVRELFSKMKENLGNRIIEALKNGESDLAETELVTFILADIPKEEISPSKTEQIPQPPITKLNKVHTPADS